MVERAFLLLDLLAAHDEGYHLSELARLLGDMSKGSIHGLLKTLERVGVVEVAGGRKYVLGPRIYDLAHAYMRRGGLRLFAPQAMRRLAERTGETVILGQVESDGVQIVERVEVPAEETALQLSARCGARVHLLAGAVGRVVLAGWSPARRKEYLSTRTLPRFTEHSITDRDAYLAAVQETERSGIGEDREEYIEGVNAVAAPIRGLGGELIALIWIVGFCTRFTDDALERAGQALREETEAISKALGAG
jgi:IclR family acetate operon transcriptional repressor